MEWKAFRWTNGIPFPKRWMKWNLLRAEGELQWALQGFRVSPAPGFQIFKAGGLVFLERRRTAGSRRRQSSLSSLATATTTQSPPWRQWPAWAYVLHFLDSARSFQSDSPRPASQSCPFSWTWNLWKKFVGGIVIDINDKDGSNNNNVNNDVDGKRQHEDCVCWCDHYLTVTPIPHLYPGSHICLFGTRFSFIFLLIKYN